MRAGREVVWEKLSELLRTFTTCSTPDQALLLLHEGDHVERDGFERALASARRGFGRASSRQSVFGAVVEHEHRWTLRAEEIPQALDLLRTLEPLPRHAYLGSAISIAAQARFLLRDPDTGRLLEGQGAALYGRQEADVDRLLGESFLSVRLSGSSTCSLFLSLPFPDATPEAKAYVTRLEVSLPFRMSRKHWTRWQLNKAGTRYYRRRIDVLD
jgi:hypothetical protein